ncbi:hypothetical protein CRG98_028751 [Punica granatum]|nr:hypothetical protein CRG98_028751 [Punica granatum]
MLRSGVDPNDITITTLLSGCADFPDEAGSLGASVHGLALKTAMARGSVMVGTAVIDMYAKRGDVGSARMAFDRMGGRNPFTWNTMIDGYMRNREIGPALELFDEMPHRDAISWTVLINGFIKGGYFDEALDFFSQMQLSGVKPDYVTIISVLAACANLGSLGLGLWVNRLIISKHFRDNVRVCNALIDMYCRCGCVDLARQVFQKMPERTVVSWNSIIVGSAANGHAELALEFFKSMQAEGFQPDGVTFTGALTACSHAGLVKEGLQYFDTMKRVHRIRPRIEHFGCLVDLYSRAGRLEDALRVIETMPVKPNEVILGSLLAACRTHEDVNLAEKLMKYLVDVDPDSDSNYVLLSNIYAAVGEWDGANKIRRKMKSRGIQKKPGFSSLEVSCTTHEFVSCDKSHPDSEQIYAMLDFLSSELRVHGYVPEAVELALYEND